jgi:hypothetical protein
VLEQDRQGAFGDGAEPDEENFVMEFDHDAGSRSAARVGR